MEKITINKQQAQAIARAIIPDIKGYCSKHFERYFPWYINEIRREKGKPPLKPVIEITIHHLSDVSNRPDDCMGFCPTCDYLDDCSIQSWMTGNKIA